MRSILVAMMKSQGRCRAARRADVPRPTGSERSENSRGNHICSRSGSRASIGRLRRRNRIRPCGELMPPGLFGSTTIYCSACMGRPNIRGTAGAPGLVVALESVSKMAADITDSRALGSNLRLIRSPRQRLLARANVVDRMSGSMRVTAPPPRIYPKGTGPNWTYGALDPMPTRAGLAIAQTLIASVYGRWALAD
jgi:hypothetical protein